MLHHMDIFFPHIMKTAGSSFLSHARDNLPDGVYQRSPWCLHEPVEPFRDNITKLLLKLDPTTVLLLTPDERDRFRLFQGHVPAASAALLDGPVRTVVLLREPVARAMSHLVQETYRPGVDPDTVPPPPERYELPFPFIGDPTNHQVKMLGTSEASVRSSTPRSEVGDRLRAATVRLAVALGEEDQAAALADLEAIAATPEARREQAAIAEAATVDGVVDVDRLVESMVDPALLRADPADDTSLAAACECLREAEIVGTTEDYPAFLTEVRDRFQWRIPRPRKVNVGLRVELDAALQRRIRADNEFDIELYQRALEEIDRRRRRTVLGGD
ncbi:MAG: hypothetical protein JJU45_01500 [Acidimicrobiia bacterium]|nr:hypothetical protein [Acidimicrobiia bacterium]